MAVQVSCKNSRTGIARQTVALQDDEKIDVHWPFPNT